MLQNAAAYTLSPWQVTRSVIVFKYGSEQLKALRVIASESGASFSCFKMYMPIPSVDGKSLGQSSFQVWK